MAASPAAMLGAATLGRLLCTSACVLALESGMAPTPSCAQPRDTMSERRPPEGSLARGVMPAPRWAILAGAVVVAAAAGALLLRRSRRRSR